MFGARRRKRFFGANAGPTRRKEGFHIYVSKNKVRVVLTTSKTKCSKALRQRRDYYTSLHSPSMAHAYRYAAKYTLRLNLSRWDLACRGECGIAQVLQGWTSCGSLLQAIDQLRKSCASGSTTRARVCGGAFMVSSSRLS